MEHARLQREPTTSEPDTKRTRSARQSCFTGPSFSFLDNGPPVLRLVTHSKGSAAATVQAKLHISKPGDQYEQEADRVAEHIMRMPDPATRLQRKCSSCDEEHKLQRIQPGDRTIIGAPPSISQAVSSGGGHSLDSSDRKFFEPRFGYDFGAVRIHADSQAAQAAQAVNARAFTLGRSIYFGSNEYRPRSSAGRQLLAHELTHVVHQSGTPPTKRRSTLGPMSTSPLMTMRSGPQIQRLCSCAEQLSFRSSGTLQGAFGINQYWPTVTPYWGSNSTLGAFDVAHTAAGWRYIGHKFQVVGRFSQQNAPATGRATFRQNARITSGTAAPGTAGRWINDMNYTDAQGRHHAWDPNAEVGTNGAGGNAGVRRTIEADKYAYTDPPALPYQPGVTNSYRKLQLTVHFRSAPGCPCAHAERTAHKTQEISIVNGVPTVLRAP